jgi:hypothetical protein
MSTTTGPRSRDRRERPHPAFTGMEKRLVPLSTHLEMSETCEGEGEKYKKRNFKRREQQRRDPEQKCIQELVFNSASGKEQRKTQGREDP